MLTLSQRVERASDRGHALTFVVGGEALAVPYAQLHEEARAYAANLQALGVAPGDHVGILGPTSRSLVTAIQAVWLAGATVVVLPLPMRMSSIEEFVGQTRCRILNADITLVLVDPELAPFVEPEPGDPPMVGWEALEPGPGRATAAAWVRPDEDLDRLAILQFTSGSTSDPKGVMLPHRTVGANLDAHRGGGRARRRRRRARLLAAAVPRHGPGRDCSPRLSPRAPRSCWARRPTSPPARAGGWSGSRPTAAPPPPGPTSPTCWPPARWGEGTCSTCPGCGIALNGAEPVDPATVEPVRGGRRPPRAAARRGVPRLRHGRDRDRRHLPRADVRPPHRSGRPARAGGRALRRTGRARPRAAPGTSPSWAGPCRASRSASSTRSPAPSWRSARSESSRSEARRSLPATTSAPR